MKPVLHSNTNSIGADAIAKLLRRMTVSAWVRDFRLSGIGREPLP
jgi:hypothetical protein